MKTYYLSEDNDTSPFVRLFNAVYGMADVLIGVGRNAKLFNKAKYLSADGSRVVIYLDIVPDNARLYAVYDRLRKLNIELDRDVHIIPIACAEFAFICSVQNLVGPIWSSEGLTEILSKDLLYEESSLARKHSSKRSSSFERVCKLFCEYGLNFDCCSVPDGDSAKSADKPYFSGDCKCYGCRTRLSLQEKSDLFVSQYPIIPHLDGLTTDSFAGDELLRAVCAVVDDFNNWASSVNGLVLGKRLS